jgi:hypothetical protein
MNLNTVIGLLKTFGPISIFIYGSQANKTINSKSDYEIGIIFNDDKYTTRQEIKTKIPDSNYNIFPFKLSDIKTRTLDTPFQKDIFIASLICGNAKTVLGKKIIENLDMPKISKHDLLMDTSFNLGYALSAVRLMKENVKDLAKELFYKSMFFATRNLYYSKNNILLSGYINIFEASKQLDIPEEYKYLLDIGNKIRTEQLDEIDISLFFKNISYINKFVIPTIENSLTI